jgi:hypothetical protein
MSQHQGRDEILRMLADPTVETNLPGGGVRIVKGGVAGPVPPRGGHGLVGAVPGGPRRGRPPTRHRPSRPACQPDGGSAAGLTRAGSEAAPAGAGAALFSRRAGERAGRLGGCPTRLLVWPDAHPPHRPSVRPNGLGATDPR